MRPIGGSFVVNPHCTGTTEPLGSISLGTVVRFFSSASLQVFRDAAVDPITVPWRRRPSHQYRGSIRVTTRTTANCTSGPIPHTKVMVKNWTMELDQPNLQLILNVVMTTGATSSALICYLLKQDNLRITAELDRRNGLGASLPVANAPKKSALHLVVTQL